MNDSIEEKYPPNRVFDLPLSKFGIEQAQNFAEILSKKLSKLHDKMRPNCIYVSPMVRMIQTGVEICKILKLKMIIVPSLSLSCNIVHETNIKFDNLIDCNLQLSKQYIENIQSVFLTKKEILKRFKCKEFDIEFMDKIHDSFNECVLELIEMNKFKTIVCISHREKHLKFKIDFNKFENLKQNVFGKINFKRCKAKPNHCEMFKYVYNHYKNELWYDGKIEDVTVH